MRRFHVIVGLGVCLFAFGCGKSSDSNSSIDNTETAQQIGDVMASIDESGGSNVGDIALLEAGGAERMFARLDSHPAHPVRFAVAMERWNEILIPRAQAASCRLSPGFGSCSGTTLVRNFNGCTIGASALTGTVALTWGDGASGCAFSANGQSITRVPNFTISGRRGGSLAVTKSGSVGQKITRSSAGVFGFTSDGIRRVISSNSTVLYDFTTRTTGSGLVITGASRNGRTLSSSGSDSLLVTNNLTSRSCDFVPSNVTWTNSCNCATSGTWSATCSDGKSATLELTGCGTGSFTMDGSSQTVTFDRCYGS